MVISLEALSKQYQLLFDTMIIHPGKMNSVIAYARQMTANKARYESVLAAVKKQFPASSIPWQFIACVHYMEAGLSFNRHLHNGDKLTARTVQVPKGRPISGQPPFTFEFSATDALVYQGLHKETNWGIPNMLYKLEAYNGFGYRQYHNINSPY